MNYLLTGVTGSLGSYILKDLASKDPNARFVLPIRSIVKKGEIQRRFHNVLKKLAKVYPIDIEDISRRSTLLELDSTKQNLGFSEGEIETILHSVDRFVHCAASVRFDLTYEKARQINVEFTKNVFELFKRTFNAQTENPNLGFYHISTAYSCGVKPGFIPENLPEDQYVATNTYVQTKAEAKHYLLSQDEKYPILIFEPSIIGADSTNGFLPVFSMHYTFLTGYLNNQFPFFCYPNGTLDIVPINWVSAVVVDHLVIPFKQRKVLRLVMGSDAFTIRELEHHCNQYLRSLKEPIRIRLSTYIPSAIVRFIVDCKLQYFKLMHVLTKKSKYLDQKKNTEIILRYFDFFAYHFEFDREDSLRWILNNTDQKKPELLLTPNTTYLSDKTSYFKTAMDFFMKKRGNKIVKKS